MSNIKILLDEIMSGEYKKDILKQEAEMPFIGEYQMAYFAKIRANMKSDLFHIVLKAK